MDKHRIELEEKHETQHLPANVREMLYQMAYGRGHSAGFGEVELEYDDIADLVKMAYSAGYDAARTVCELEAVPVVDMDAARWTFADAAVMELRKGFEQDRWAKDRGHRWDASGKFIKAGDL